MSKSLRKSCCLMKKNLKLKEPHKNVAQILKVFDQVLD